MKSSDVGISMAPLSGSDEPKYLLREKHFYSERVKKAWGGQHIMHGLTPDENSILLVSNDYLSLADCREILEAQSQALLAEGNGLLMSGIFLHGENPQAELEKRMAAFMSVEHAILTQSGWCANVGLLQTIADETTPVYLDILCHMSLWEGVKSAGATAHMFHHNSAEHLEKQIKQHGAGVIVVDSVYSTNGSVCPLEEIVDVGHRHGCVMVVDESHSLGTHGERGEGLVASLGLSKKVQFITASLAKAFAGRAGIITCSNEFSDYFKFTSRPAIFSSTLLPHEIVALQKTLDVIMSSNDRRQRLRLNADILRQGLSDIGYNVDISQSQIIPLEAGPEWRTIKLRDALESRGVFGAVFCAPATSKNRSLIRLSVNAALDERQLRHILRVCEVIRAEVELSEWPSTKKRSSMTKVAAAAN